MPVKIPQNLPAVKVLAAENIFTITDQRADTQDIRPLKIAVLNLMPTKETTETQILRLLSNTALQIEVTLLHTASYSSRNTSEEHLDAFYRTFEDVKTEMFDGLIVTGAPVEKMAFEDVTYWQELTTVLDWAEHHAFSTLFICWAAQAALHYHYGIEKRPLPQKLFGVFPHKVLQPTHKLVQGFDDLFYAPHSRHTTIAAADVLKCSQLELLSASEEAGAYLIADKSGSRIFVTGHCEYDANTLDLEYRRDLTTGQVIQIPQHYYQNDDPCQPPLVRWRAHGNLLFGNWLNYFVYQETPYDIQAIPGQKEKVRAQG